MPRRAPPTPRGPADWESLRARLAAAAAGCEARAGARERILRERATKLAHPPTHAIDGAFEILEFGIGAETWAVALRNVREVCPLDRFSALPCAPDFVRGIISLRGEIVAVLDLRRIVGMGERGLSDLGKVVVLASPTAQFGILADSVSGTRRICHQDIQSGMATLGGIRSEFLLGIEGGRTVLVDAERLLASARLVVDERVTG